jgi:subtilisin family serine protease
MIKAMTCSFLVFAFLLGLSPALMADETFVPPEISAEQRYLPGRIIVQFKDTALPEYFKKMTGEKIAMGISSVDMLNSRFGASSVEQLFYGSESNPNNAELNLAGFYVIEIDPDMDVMQAVLEYGKDPAMVMAQPDYIYPFRELPNDNYFSDQYWLEQLNDNDIDAPEAWNYESGSDTIIVGVNDSGVLWDHPDLLPNIWQNLGEDLDGDGRTIENGQFDPGDVNGLDNDGNGKADDFIGWDWVHVGTSQVCTDSADGEDALTPDNDPTDFSGHGTNIAGLIAASTNNILNLGATSGEGVAGIAGGFAPHFPGVKIMCLRTGFMNPDCLTGGVYSYGASQAIYYAVDKGVDVINISFGPQYTPPCTYGYGNDNAMRSAILNALSNDVVITIAGGNDGVDCPDYMAVIDGVINVAALDQNDNRASFSNHGDWIHISAAGVTMQSTESHYGSVAYAGWDGTSYSAPVVAGVAALIRSHNPSLDRDSVKNILMNTADPLSNPDLGAGRVNALNAILSLPTAYFTSNAADSFPPFPPFTVDFTDASPTAGITSWDWDFGDGGNSSVQNPSHEYTQAGLYDVSLTITSPDGSDTYTFPKRVYALGDTLWIDQVSAAEVNDEIDLYFNLKNVEAVQELKIPFEYDDTYLEWLDYSVHVDGTRCENFEKASIVGAGLGRGYIHLRADNSKDYSPGPLEPGEGPICYIKFRVDTEGTGTISLADWWQVFFSQGVYYKYEPVFIDGFITTDAGCQGICGDANGDQNVNVSDGVYIINYVFVGGDPPQPVMACGDANSDETVNVSDAVYIINYVFTGGADPGDCSPGSAEWNGNDCCPF